MKTSLSKTLRTFSKHYLNVLTRSFPEFHSEYMIEILLLLDEPSRITQKRIGQCLDVDKSRVAVMVKQLEELEYVSIETNIKDRREHFVALTKQGQELVPHIKEVLLSIDAELSKNLSETKLIQFYATLWQMNQNLKERSVFIDQTE